eukprot:1430279-Amphidinium_carterae.1
MLSGLPEDCEGPYRHWHPQRPPKKSKVTNRQALQNAVSHQHRCPSFSSSVHRSHHGPTRCHSKTLSCIHAAAPRRSTCDS